MNNRILGTEGADLLTGADLAEFAAADSIDGAEGNDTLLGGAGKDLLSGGAGKDVLEGGAGDDRLFAGPGQDTLTGGEGFDWIDFSRASAGIDFSIGVRRVDSPDGRLVLADALEAVTGTPFADTLTGGYRTESPYPQIIEGGGGPDGLRGPVQPYGGVNFQRYVFDGGAGDDTITGGASDDTIRGSRGDDLIHGGYEETWSVDFDDDGLSDYWIETTSHDTLDYSDVRGAIVVNLSTGTVSGRGAGNDVFAAIDLIIGTRAADTFLGATRESGSDWISLHGNRGDDTLLGRDDADILAGDEGADSLRGAAGADQLAGGAGDDSLDGGPGQDRLDGGSGDDLIAGSDSHDRLGGGTGQDTLTGGAGDDTFVFAQPPLARNLDRIADFESGSDRIELDSLTFAALAPNGFAPLDPSRFVAGSLALDADDRILYDAAAGHLYYDRDGSGPAAARLLALLEPGTPLGAPDLLVA